MTNERGIGATSEDQTSLKIYECDGISLSFGEERIDDGERGVPKERLDSSAIKSRVFLLRLIAR